MSEESIFSNPDLVDAIFDYIVLEFPEIRTKAEELKAAARAEFAGTGTYIPKRSAIERDRLASDVMDLFNGRNASEIARRLKIGRATVYRIIKTSGGKRK